MTAMPCGKKKHSNATSQSHRATDPLVAIDETVLRLRMATTNKSAKSHRPSSRRRALVGLALIGQPELSFMVSGRPASRGKRGPSLQILHHQKVDACLMTAVLQRAPTGSHKAPVWCLRSGPSRVRHYSPTEKPRSRGRMTGCVGLVALGIFDSITNPPGVQQHELSQRAYPIISLRRQGPNSDKTLSAGPISHRG